MKKAGRPINIKTPEMLWDLFSEYKAYCKENPIRKQDYVGKDAEMVYRQLERPLTMEGFECFVMNKSIIAYPDLTNYFEGKIKEFEIFLPVTARIKREIRADQIEGGMVGVYNHNLTSRLNALSDNVNNSTELKVTGLDITVE